MKPLNAAGVWHSFLAIATGFGVLTVLVLVATTGIRKFFPGFCGSDAHPNGSYLVTNLAYSAASAFTGGFITAQLASPQALPHILMLALAVLLLSALSAAQLRGQQPVVYQFAQVVLIPLAVLGGGLLQIHRAG